jgi:thiol-disulfide isomerase/thioredoxin
MRRLVPILLTAAALAGCGDEPESAAPDGADAQRALAGSPPALAALHRQANQLIGGGDDAFRARLRALRGNPIVVNKWASWCPPCRDEFPVFQRVSVALGREVAFLGVDSDDNDDDARAFLGRYPVSYPSYRDPEERVARVFKGHLAFPTTAFYDARGKLAFVHQGPYDSDAALRRDIEEYAR